MARPADKNELLSVNEKVYQKLNELIDSFTPEQQLREFLAGTMNRNIWDVFLYDA
jgi:hypothetical protein